MSVAVIGSGINGLLLTYWLQQAGHSVEVFDSESIPNSTAASFGRHRLIHPWGNSEKARLASQALTLWKNVLETIACDGFEATGVFASNSDAPELDYNMLEIHSRDAIINSVNDMFSQSGPLKGTLFPEYGILFADQILNDLTAFLVRNSIRLHHNRRVVSIDAQSGSFTLDDGTVQYARQIVLAAGTGSGHILQNSPSLNDLLKYGFQTMCCYVVYIGGLPEASATAPSFAWADLGENDMWGMPAIRGIPAKLGCGKYTHPIADDAQYNKSEIGQLIKYEYAARFPAFSDALIQSVSQNSWTSISSSELFHNIGRCWVVTSDNGGGFKMAPAMTSKLANAMLSKLE